MRLSIPEPQRSGIEEIAARAGVGVGTVYRRFASKDALIDELLRLAMDELTTTAGEALSREDGHGLEELREATAELTARAGAAGTVGPGITSGDVTALISAMRAMVQAPGDATPERWQRFLDIHLAGMRATRLASLPE